MMLNGQSNLTNEMPTCWLLLLDVSLFRHARNDIPSEVEGRKYAVPQQQSQVPSKVRHEAVQPVGVVLLFDVVKPGVVEQLQRQSGLVLVLRLRLVLRVILDLRLFQVVRLVLLLQVIPTLQVILLF